METAAQSRLRLLLVVCLLASVVALIPPSTPAAAQGMCFPETGKCISGLFAQYWLANGGLRQQGYPITDVFDEFYPTDCKTYPTQYFERGRF